MPRIIAVTRAHFGSHFPKTPWTAGNVVHKNVYMSKVECSEAFVRQHLGQFLTEQHLNFRSPLYRFHLIMDPQVMNDEGFKQKVLEIMDRIGVKTTFHKTCGSGDSSFLITGVRASEVELIEYCDILITCK